MKKWIKILIGVVVGLTGLSSAAIIFYKHEKKTINDIQRNLEGLPK
jgi:hypothetical protein